MAEMGKGGTAGKLAISVQKRLTRAQEKVMQKLGKADETRDAAFEEMVANFNKQMTEGGKLQKDLKAYLLAVKTMHDASRRLQDCLADMYEPDWFGKEEMDALTEDTDTLWLDYHQNIMDKPLTSLDSYLAQFPDIKARIAKRDRKMVDFDSARHHFSSLQKGKKKDEAKIAKQAALLEMAAPSWAQGLISAHQVAQTNLSFNQAEEELGRAQKIFEELNVELQDELPSLWDNRVGVYVNTFQGLAGHQEKFHGEMSKLSQNLNDIMTKLEEQRELKKDASAAAKTGEGSRSEGPNHSESASSAPKRPGPPPSRPAARPAPSPDLRQQRADSAEDEEPDADADSAVTAATGPATTQQAPSWDPWREQTTAEHEDQRHLEEVRGGWGGGGHAAPSSSEPGWGADGAQVGGDWGDAGEAQNAVTNGSDGDLPPGFLYKVKAVHEYAATDGDELELKIGDDVLVLAFDNPDEQDDGWLLGVLEAHWLQNKDTSAKGVFPENFTQKV
uniref:myc box-dependent-interacting protein 1b isoform X2 n=1 Tax=Gasterosteus aculeatus aculeatus TaxID=481459 RepID=UPI001A99C00D|nr:myc box-dependent-interacting protein 1b isoform X2 [Gasterosteus aculeatus aculeatus]